MTDRRIFTLAHDIARQGAIECVRNAPDGWCVEVRPPKRSLDQNAALWAALGDVADGVVWHGQRLSAEQWKDVFTAGLKRQEVVPGIDGGFVVLGTSTRRMTKREMSDLLDLVHAFGNERNVQWSDRAIA